MAVVAKNINNEFQIYRSAFDGEISELSIERIIEECSRIENQVQGIEFFEVVEEGNVYLIKAYGGGDGETTNDEFIHISTITK